MPAAVPRSLRAWFLLHFAISCVFALPLFFAPRLVLGSFGWITIDPALTRLVAAALLAIGGSSFLMRDAGVTVYRALLGLDLLWSTIAAAGLAWSARQGAPPFTWALCGGSASFALVWFVWWRRLGESE